MEPEEQLETESKDTSVPTATVQVVAVEEAVSTKYPNVLHMNNRSISTVQNTSPIPSNDGSINAASILRLLNNPEKF